MSFCGPTRSHSIDQARRSSTRPNSSKCIRCLEPWILSRLGIHLTPHESLYEEAHDAYPHVIGKEGEVSNLLDYNQQVVNRSKWAAVEPGSLEPRSTPLERELGAYLGASAGRDGLGRRNDGRGASNDARCGATLFDYKDLYFII